MNIKKALSLLTAAALSISSFAALAVTASADVTTIPITFYAVADNDTTTQNPIKREETGNGDYKNGRVCGNETSQQLNSDTSAKMKELWGGNSDATVINSEYTKYYYDYIGTGYGTPYIEVTNLAAGTYAMFYLGKNNYDGTHDIENVTFTDMSDDPVSTASYEAYGARNIGELVVHKFQLSFTESFTGKIKFVNTTSGLYLPDLYAIKITNDTFDVGSITNKSIVHTLSPGEDSIYRCSSANSKVENGKTDNLQTTNKKAIIKYPDIDFTGTNIHAVQVSGATNNKGNISLYINGTCIGTMSNFSTGSYSDYKDITFTNINSSNLKGDVMLVIENDGSYAGNYGAIKLYSEASLNTVYKATDLFSCAGTTGTIVRSGSYTNEENYKNYGAPFGSFHNITTENYPKYATKNSGSPILAFGNLASGTYTVSILVREWYQYYPDIYLDGTETSNRIYQGSSKSLDWFANESDSSQKIAIEQATFTINDSENHFIIIDTTNNDIRGILAVIVTAPGYSSFNSSDISNGKGIGTLSDTGSSYQRFAEKGGALADAYMTSIDFDKQYAANGLKWCIYKTGETKHAEITATDTTISGGTVYFGLVLTGTEDELNSITNVELR